MDSEELLAFEPAAGDARRATVTVDPAKRGPCPISSLLLGKFCEHLGCNIYHGMEAQILYNPTFGDMKVGEPFFKHMGERFGWPDTKAMVEAHRDGGAPGWLRLGPAEEVLLSPDAGPHGTRAQRFEVAETAEADGGIEQWAYLPLHRTRGYEFRVVARAVRPCRVVLRLSSEEAAPVAEAAVELGDGWTTATGRLDLPADAGVDPDRPLRFAVLAAPGANVVIDRVLLYPDDHVGHADPEIIALLADARLPLLRYPGGNFVSGYHWRDGVGPADARPTLPNLAWGGVLEPNLFGTDEFIDFCRAVGCEPMICVNAGSGTPAEAAGWVEYCNGSTETPLGRLRADNGHPEPHGIRYWEIGNEIFGRHQIGWTTPAGNTDRYRRFAEAMRAADPTIRLLACGGLHLGVEAEWNRRLLAEVPEADCHTHHILEGGNVDETIDPAELYHAFMAYPTRVAADYGRMRQCMLEAGIGEPRIAITELQLFAGYAGKRDSGRPAVQLPTNDTISEALYTTLILHECIRLGELVEMITHSATVNHGGGLRKSRQRVWPNPVHHAHAMGAALTGATPVAVRLSCGTFSTTHEFGHLPVVEAAPDLDALAAVTPDGKTLILSLVHRSAAAGPIEVAIDLGGFAAGRAEVLTLAGQGLHDANTFDEPDRVHPRPSSAEVEDGRLALSLPPFSVTQVRLRPQG